MWATKTLLWTVWNHLYASFFTAVIRNQSMEQGCNLGLDVSVSRRIFPSSRTESQNLRLVSGLVYKWQLSRACLDQRLIAIRSQGILGYSAITCDQRYEWSRSITRSASLAVSVPLAGGRHGVGHLPKMPRHSTVSGMGGGKGGSHEPLQRQ